jgi:hypothetical protein
MSDRAVTIDIMAGNLTKEKSSAQRDPQYGDLGSYRAIKMESSDFVMMT